MPETLHDATIGAVTIKQVTDGRFAPNNRVLPGRASAAVDPSALYITGGNPRHQMSSLDLGGVIAGLDIAAGLDVASGSIVLPFRKRVAGGTFASGTSHFTLTGANAFSFIQSISGGQQEDAVAVLETLFESTDGQAVPCTANVSQSLSAAAFNALWTLAQVKLNTGGGLTQVTGLQRATVNTGIQVQPGDAADGALYPQKHYIVRRDPFIDLAFLDFDKLDEASYGLLFKTLTGLQVFFQKRAEGGTLVSSATGAHIQLSFADCINDVQDLGANGAGDGTTTIRVWGEALTASATATF